MDIRHLQIRTDPDLKRRLRIVIAEREETMQDYLMRAIEKQLQADERRLGLATSNSK